MEIRYSNGIYRVTDDPQGRTYKTRRGAEARKRDLLARAEHAERSAFIATQDVSWRTTRAPLPDNVVPFPGARTARTDLGADATVLRLEFLHRGYTAAWNLTEDRPTAGPALIAEWRSHGGRTAWLKAKGPRRFKTDRERVAELQRERGERYDR